MERSNRWVRPAGVILLALGIRVFMCAQPACIGRDGVHFVSFAKQLADDPITWMRVTTKQPGYSGLLLGTHRLLGEVMGGDTPEGWQRCGELLALLGGVGVCAGVYFLTRRLLDEQTALVAGILAALWPQGAYLSAQVLSDMPHLALYLFGLLWVYGAMERPGLGRFALCGLIMGAAYLIRQEALGLVAGSVIGAWWWSGGKTIRKRITYVSIIILGFTVVVAPYAIVKGQIIPNKGLEDLFDTSGGASMQWAGVFPLADAFPLWQLPGRMAEAWGRSGRYVFSTLFVIGLFLKSMPRAEQRGRRLVLIVTILHLLLVVARVGKYGVLSSRYMMIPVALCLPWAAAALVMMLRLSSQRSGKRRLIIVAGICGIVSVPLVYYLSVPVNDGKQPYRAAGLWLAQHAAPEDRILAHRDLEQVMYYSGRTYPREDGWSPFTPGAGLDELKGIVAKSGAKWFVDVRGSHRGKMDEVPWFDALLGGQAAGLDPVYDAGPKEARAYVFRVGR